MYTKYTFNLYFNLVAGVSNFSRKHVIKKQPLETGNQLVVYKLPTPQQLTIMSPEKS